MRSLSSSSLLGSYSDREEHQVDRVIVWVMRPLPDSPVRANWIFNDLWEAISAVVSVAELKSREQIPWYWDAHDKAGTSSNRLTVYGIWINPDGSATYEVGSNYKEYSSPPPELPDDYSLMISRSPDGILLTL
jgi:hypothetical protein